MAEYVVVDKSQLEADLTIVADSIRAKGGTTESLAFPNGMKQAVEAIEIGITPTGTIEITENGIHDVANYASANVNVASGGYDFMEYITTISGMFYYSTFPNEYTLSINVPNIRENANCDNFISNSNIYKIVLSGNSNKNKISLHYAFNQCKQLIEVDLSDFCFKPTGAQYTFGSCNSLEKIIGVIDLTEAIDIKGIFYGCNKIKEVHFVKETIKLSISFVSSPLLSDNSVQSIIDGLADLTVLDTQTLTLHADVKAKLTEEQITQITSKNWTLA